jgi:hypothetical protein
LYPAAGNPDPDPDTAVPTAGVVLLIRLIPNCFVLVVEAVGEVKAVIVLFPAVVRVLPATDTE